MGSFLKSNVFDKTGASSIDERTFMGSLAGFIAYGLAVTYLMASYFAPAIPSLTYIICVGLIVPIIGIFMSQSDSFSLSFLGYNLIVAPIGLTLGPIAHYYSPDVVQNAALLTLIITGMMGFAGVTYPDFFKKIGNVLFYSLICLLIVRIIGIFVPAIGSFGLIDYIAASIFSLYIGYDMYRSTQVQRTVTNALHISVSLYLDIINLFLSLTNILKR